MSEFIGSRISLISKSDIRYVGTLVEINSEKATVALENVMSYGTEDRRTGAESFPPSSSLYDYILFRGSDVKDLRIEEPPKEAASNRPQMPNDPAILGSARPDKSTPSQQPSQPSATGPPQGPPNQQGQQFPPQPSQFNQYGPYGGMPPQGFGRGFPGGPPPGPGYPGYPGMQFGPGGPPGPPPPGWYGPPGQNFGPPQFGQGPPPGPGGPDAKGSVQLPNRDQRPVEKDTDTKTPEPVAATKKPAGKKDPNAPPPPVESKPDVAAALAPPHGAKAAPKGRVQPAVPIPSQKAAANGAGNDSAAGNSAMGNMSQTTAQQAAAAVAAAMARLPNPGAAVPSQPRQNNGMEDLTRKLNDMRTHDGSRGRGSRGAGRGRGRGNFQKVEIPATDFDFESANKKFNKEDVAKEAQIGSPDPNQHGSGAETPEPAASASSAAVDDVVIPPAAYNKSSSFFDNISSELKDREEQKSFGGSEFRHQERRKNMETFGQGSIDGYRGGFRGRGRGRGRGGQGRGMGSGGYGRGGGGGRGGAAPRGETTA